MCNNGFLLCDKFWCLTFSFTVVIHTKIFFEFSWNALIMSDIYERPNTKICLHRVPRMEQKCGKCWKSQLWKLNWWFLLVIWVKWKQSVCSVILPYSCVFYNLFTPFFVLEIFKFQYDKFFVRHSASISKFEWFEQ